MQTAMGHRPGAGASGLQIPLNLVWISCFLAIAPLFINDAIGPVSPLFLLVFGGLLALRSVPQAVHDIARYHWLLIYPAYAILSTTWSIYPDVSLRHSVQLMITFILGIVVARCLTAKGLHRIFFLALSIAILISLAFGNHRFDGIALGIFNSKNSYAAALGISILASATMAIDKTAPLFVRAFGCVMVAAGGVGLVTAESAGTVITLVPSLGVGMSVLALGWMPSKVRQAIVAVIIVAALFVGTVAFLFGQEILSLILSTTGKDATLTGRTELWDIAKAYIAERPLLGLGYRAFWVQGFGPAEALWLKFGILSKSGFNFHNQYYDMAVQLGVIGTLMTVIMLAWALVSAFRVGIRQPSAPIVFIISMLVFMTARSFGEVGPFFEFSGWTVFVVSVIVLYGSPAKPREPRRARRVRHHVAGGGQHGYLPLEKATQ